MQLFYIDFSSWVIEADNSDDAIKRAESFLANGKIPPVCAVSECGDEQKCEEIECTTTEELKANLEYKKNYAGEAV